MVLVTTHSTPTDHENLPAARIQCSHEEAGKGLLIKDQQKAEIQARNSQIHLR